MEIRHLKLVKAIVEEGSITKAISKLHLTQSALSYQLKEAEIQIGTQIFLRVNKKLILTKAGEEIYSLAKEVVEKLLCAEDRIKQLVYGETGEIRISTECYTSYHWLPSLMKQFQSLYPNIDLRIIMEATHYPLQKLLTGELDIAITSDPIKDENILYTELFQDEMIAVVSEKHPWTKKKFVQAVDFIDQNLIIHSLPLETVSIHQFVLAPAKVVPKKIIVLPLTEASIEMVKADMGVMVIARWAVKQYLQNNSLKTVQIGRNGFKRKQYVATLKSKATTTYFNHFIEFVKEKINLLN